MLFQTNRKQRMRAALPDALLARSQPDRGGVLETKELLRRAGSETRGAVIEAMGRALDAVTARDTRGFFEHCGTGQRVNRRNGRREFGYSSKLSSEPLVPCFAVHNAVWK